MRYATETSAIQFLFSFTLRWITFLNTFFRTPKKKPWTIAFGFFKFDETMTSPKLCKKHIMQKPCLKGAEWRLFQRRSIFQ